jgi:tetratricopeptide (TPR) repeat protein
MARTLNFKTALVTTISALLLIGSMAFAQDSGGVTGKVTGEDGKPQPGVVVQIDRLNVKWSVHTKTNKKGEYTYIGLFPDVYTISILGPDGTVLTKDQKQVKVGDPTEDDFDLAKLHADAEKAQEANPQYQKAVEEHKQSMSLKQTFDQGQELYDQKKYTDAAAIFEKALPDAKDRNAIIIEARLADTWERAGETDTDPDKRKEDYGKAQDYFNKVIAVDPNDAQVHNNLGHLYAQIGRSAEASAEFQKAAQLDPNHASTYYFNLGITQVNLGKMDDAEVALKKAIDLNPNYGPAYYWYGMALMGKATIKPDGTMVPAPGTIEAFQSYLKLEPSGQHAAEAQASIDTLSGKANMEYKKNKK